jgi:hypothetical protein
MKLYELPKLDTGTKTPAARLRTPKLRAIGEEKRERSRREGVFRRAMGDWLDEGAWSHVVSLTAAGMATTSRLSSKFHNYARRVGRIARRPLAWFYVIERGHGGDRPHLHALLANTGELSTKQLENAWRLGYTRVAKYDPMQGASYYITKDIATNAVEYDISRGRVPRL